MFTGCPILWTFKSPKWSLTFNNREWIHPDFKDYARSPAIDGKKKDWLRKMSSEWWDAKSLKTTASGAVESPTTLTLTRMIAFPKLFTQRNTAETSRIVSTSQSMVEIRLTFDKKWSKIKAQETNAIDDLRRCRHHKFCDFGWSQTSATIESRFNKWHGIFARSTNSFGGIY